MNQQDETVVTPPAPMPYSDSPSTPDQATEIPAAVTSVSAQAPIVPVTFPTNLPDTQTVTSSDNPVVITQPMTDTPSPTQPEPLKTSISSAPVSVDLPPVEATPEPVKTVPLPTQVNTNEVPASETKPLEMSQASQFPSLSSMPAPVSNSIPDISAEITPPMPVASADDMMPTNTLPSIEPLQTSADVPSQLKPPITMSNPPTPPLLSETPSPSSTPKQYMDPVVIEAKPLMDPEPLPTPLTPPTIKTSPSPVLSNPNSSPASAPVNVTMNSSQLEPLNKPAGQVAPVLVKGAGKYQIRVINEKCIGAASCVAVAPKAFKLNEQQIAEVLASASEESDENLLLSAQSCPTMAIEIVDSETGKKVWPR